MQRRDVLVRRLVLDVGEAMPWHVDVCERLSIVLSGDRLRIEFRDDAEFVEVSLQPGQADWDPPEARVHRAVNVGEKPYEEVVVFLLATDQRDPQPQCDQIQSADFPSSPG